MLHIRLSSQIRFDRLSEGLSANGTGDAVLCEQRSLTVLADAEVSAGKDHDTLLLVLAYHAQLVLAIALHLKGTYGAVRSTTVTRTQR